MLSLTGDSDLIPPFMISLGRPILRRNARQQVWAWLSEWN
jgi:hypothetical protein